MIRVMLAIRSSARPKIRIQIFIIVLRTGNKGMGALPKDGSSAASR